MLSCGENVVWYGEGISDASLGLPSEAVLHTTRLHWLHTCGCSTAWAHTRGPKRKQLGSGNTLQHMAG